MSVRWWAPGPGTGQRGVQLGLARESIRRQAETQKQTASDAFGNPREGRTRQTLQEGGMRPADAEHSRTWEALGSGEKAGCEGGGHDPQRAGTGASGRRAGQLRSQPTRTAAKQTTGRMQFGGIPPVAASPSQVGAPKNPASSHLERGGTSYSGRKSRPQRNLRRPEARGGTGTGGRTGSAVETGNVV